MDGRCVEAEQHCLSASAFRCCVGEVSSLASRADLASIAEQPQVMQRVTALLECLRGAAQGTSPGVQQPLFAVCASVMEPLLVLQRAYKQHEPIVCLLLKLAGDIVDAHVSYLPVRQRQQLALAQQGLSVQVTAPCILACVHCCWCVQQAKHSLRHGSWYAELHKHRTRLNIYV